MKAIVLHGPGDVTYCDFPDPELRENGVKVAISYCGLCGTDFHKFAGKGGSRTVTYPVPLGHEASGIVKEVGSLVTKFKPGDRVTIDPNWSCGKCYWCRRGIRHMCDSSKGVVKGMADYVCAPEENVYHIPDSLSLRDACLAEPLSCCIHGMDQLDVHLGDTVAIIGLGAIGEIILQLCKRSGASNIIVIASKEEKRRKAMENGATLFINSSEENVAEAITAAGIECVDRVIECVGLPVTVNTALEIAGRGATVVLFGVNDKDAAVPLHPYDAFYKELTIKSSYINPGTTSRAIAMLANGDLDMDKIIGAQIDITELPEEMNSRKLSRLGKVVVKVAGGE